MLLTPFSFCLQLCPKREDATGAEDENLRKLFLGGLKRSTTKQDVEEYFNKLGLEVQVSVATGKDNASKGFGFVTLQTVADTDKVLLDHEEKHTELQGKRIEVRRAIPKNVSRAAANPKPLKKLWW